MTLSNPKYTSNLSIEETIEVKNNTKMLSLPKQENTNLSNLTEKLVASGCEQIPT